MKRFSILFHGQISSKIMLNDSVIIVYLCTENLNLKLIKTEKSEIHFWPRKNIYFESIGLIRLCQMEPVIL